MHENEISYIIRGSIFEVYNTLGPGLLESVYEAALALEIGNRGVEVKTQIALPVIYKSTKLDLGFRIDLLVGNKVIVEIKSIESITEVHFKILLTYLRLADKRLGILVNFSTDDIVKSIYRKVNNLDNGGDE